MKPDLNLLVVLDALCRTGSVSKASEALALSQPAVSHALNRLRAATGDPLFARSGRGLVPTPRAVALAETVAGLVATGQACLRPEMFDPVRDAPRFRLGVSDYAGMVLLPRLVARVRVLAPKAAIEARTVGPGALRQLEAGEIDLCFWGTEAPGTPFHHAALFRETFVLALRSDHPVLAQGTLGLEEYLALSHAVVSLGDPGQSPVDVALTRLGKSRSVGLASPSFAANLAAVAASDLAATIPARLEQGLPAALVTRPLPLVGVEFGYGMIWHPRGEASPALRWLRGVVGEVAQDGA